MAEIGKATIQRQKTGGYTVIVTARVNDGEEFVETPPSSNLGLGAAFDSAKATLQSMVTGTEVVQSAIIIARIVEP